MPRPQQGQPAWSPGGQQPWSAGTGQYPTGTQQYPGSPGHRGYQVPVQTGQRPPAHRGGGPNPLKWLIIAIATIIAGILLLGLLGGQGGLGDGGDRDVPPGEYHNEDYQVPPVDSNPPPIPVPETYGEATEWLVNNDLYGQSIAVPVRCESSPINLQTASHAELDRHFNELTACLARVFGPPIEDAGYVLVRPSVTVYSQPINTRCGSLPMMNAVYCGADQQVYYAIDLPQVIPPQLQGGDYVVESVLAHEFGHAIQGRTGILISSAAWEQNSTEAVANNFSRRLEVQADCFAGQFIQSVAQSVELGQNDVDMVAALFYAIGDDQLTGNPNIDGNHGHGQSRLNWFQTGYTNTAMSSCNTFVAADAEVR